MSIERENDNKHIIIYKVRNNLQYNILNPIVPSALAGIPACSVRQAVNKTPLSGIFIHLICPDQNHRFICPSSFL